MPSVIKTEDLSKFFGRTVALHSLTFEIQKGEIVGLLGPNGAGKTTTMRLITGYLKPSGGRLWIEGEDIVQSSTAFKRNIGYLPENSPLYNDLTVEASLQFAAALHRIGKGEQKEAIRAVMEKTRIADVAHRLVGHLSRGYRQRVGLAQALIHNPSLLVLDEPTMGLDPKQIIEIRELISSLGGTTTIILSSHILQEVHALCHRLLILHKGRMVGDEIPKGDVKNLEEMFLRLTDS